MYPYIHAYLTFSLLTVCPEDLKSWTLNEIKSTFVKGLSESFLQFYSKSSYHIVYGYFDTLKSGTYCITLLYLSRHSLAMSSHFKDNPN